MNLKKSTLFYYSLTEFPVTMALFPVMVFVPMFYTSEMMGVVGSFSAQLIPAVALILFGYGGSAAVLQRADAPPAQSPATGTLPA